MQSTRLSMSSTREARLRGRRARSHGPTRVPPGTLLKIYIYGYLNRVPSSRRLERETQRNLELIWLTGRLAPDFKTIADFRRDNGPGHPPGMPPVRAAVPADRAVRASAGGDRRQQVQGGQQPRQELHASTSSRPVSSSSIRASHATSPTSIAQTGSVSGA